MKLSVLFVSVALLSCASAKAKLSKYEDGELSSVSFQSAEDHKQVARADLMVNDNDEEDWIDFTPMWCTVQHRSNELAKVPTLLGCRNLCLQQNPDCIAVEWWEQSTSCFECTDPSERVSYTATHDTGYPPHVLVAPGGGWIDYTPMWCTQDHRSDRLGETATSELCKNLCLQQNPDCIAVEWWEQSTSCFECFDPSERVPYTATHDTGYPPHVVVHPEEDTSDDESEGLQDYNTQVQLNKQSSEDEEFKDPPVDGTEGLQDFNTQEQLNKQSSEGKEFEDPPVDGIEGLQDYSMQEQLDKRSTINGKEVTAHDRRRRDVNQGEAEAPVPQLRKKREDKPGKRILMMAMKKLRENPGVINRVTEDSV